MTFDLYTMDITTTGVQQIQQVYNKYNRCTTSDNEVIILKSLSVNIMNHNSGS